MKGYYFGPVGFVKAAAEIMMVPSQESYGGKMMLSIENEAGAVLALRAEGCEIRDWSFAAELNGVEVPASNLEAGAQTEDGGLSFSLSFEPSQVRWEVETSLREHRLTMASSLTNLSDVPVALGKVCTMVCTGGLSFGSGSDVVALPLSGSLTPRQVWRLSDPACPRSSKIKLQLFSLAEHRALQIGFLTFSRADTIVEISVDAAGKISAARAWCDYCGWKLYPGKTVDLEVFTVATGADPYSQLEDWADRAAELCSPRAWEDAPIGWLGWGWVDAFNVERYEDVLLRNCRAIRCRLAGFDLGYVWMSIGNIEKGYPGNWLKWNYDLFPSGPSYLVGRLKEMGFRLGLWCGMFWICSDATDVVDRLHDALLKNPDGSPLVVLQELRYGEAGTRPKAQRPVCYGLDPSHPKAHDFLREVFETYRQWGIRYYKLDFLEAGAGNISRYPYTDHHDKSLVAGPEAYHAALQVVREAAGDDTYFLSSSGPSVHNAGPMDAIRTGNDFGEGRALYPDAHFYPATFVINDSGYWTGPQRALQNQASAYYTHRRLYINDSGNVLTVDRPLPASTARIYATIHALSGGPSMLGDDVDRMDESRLDLIKKTLPRAREVAFPVDLFDSPAPDYPHVFHRKVHKPWGSYDVVAVYNFGDGLLEREVGLDRLGLEATGSYLLWEFWNLEYRGTISGALHAAVPPRSVCVYRLTPNSGRPCLLATDMHILMGEMEITSLAWNEAERRLTGTALRPAGETGSVYIHAPAGQRVANPQGLWIAKDAGEESLIIRVALEFQQGRADWEVSFADLEQVPSVDVAGSAGDITG